MRSTADERNPFVSVVGGAAESEARAKPARVRLPGARPEYGEYGKSEELGQPAYRERSRGEAKTASTRSSANQRIGRGAEEGRKRRVRLCGLGTDRSYSQFLQIVGLGTEEARAGWFHSLNLP